MCGCESIHSGLTRADAPSQWALAPLPHLHVDDCSNGCVAGVEERGDSCVYTGIGCNKGGGLIRVVETVVLSPAENRWF